jgi:hypothetical protein
MTNLDPPQARPLILKENPARVLGLTAGGG